MKTLIVLLNLFLLSQMSFARPGDYDDRRDRRDSRYDRRDRHEDRHRHHRPPPRPPRYEAPRGDELFQVAGIRLGYSTVSELFQLGARKEVGYDCYKYQNIDFWYNSHKEISHIYVIKTEVFPQEWTALGLVKEISYEEAYSLLQQLGFQIVIKKAPTQEYVAHMRTHAFKAELEGSMTDRNGKTLKISLNFAYKVGNQYTSGTLYGVRPYVR